MSGTTSGSKEKTGATKKNGRANGRAILASPVKFDGELPIKKRGGRKSMLEPMIADLQADPGTWYKLATGKTGTVSQTRSRLIALGKKMGIALQVETHAVDGEEGIADCFARVPAEKA